MVIEALQTYLDEAFQSIERYPAMWGGLDHIEATYRTLLEVEYILRGKKIDNFGLEFHAYMKLTHFLGPVSMAQRGMDARGLVLWFASLRQYLRE